jgi:hypothetical protein
MVHELVAVKHNAGMALIRLTAVYVLIGISLGGCVADDCRYEPIGASIRGPMWPRPDADAVGQCGRWIKIGGDIWTQSEYAFELDPQALEPIGEADAASRNVTALGGPTIYQIPGVDPDEAVAMEAADASYRVFIRGGSGTEFPPELCPMLGSEERPPAGLCA